MIKINGRNWDIVICEPCNPALATSAGYCALGVCDDNIGKISEEENSIIIKYDFEIENLESK